MLGLRSIFCKENHPKISPGGLLASEFPSVNTMETWKKEILKTRDDLDLTDHAKSTFCAQEFVWKAHLRHPSPPPLAAWWGWNLLVLKL